MSLGYLVVPLYPDDLGVDNMYYHPTGGHIRATHLRVVLLLVGDQGKYEALRVQGDVLAELSAIMVTLRLNLDKWVEAALYVEHCGPGLSEARSELEQESLGDGSRLPEDQIWWRTCRWCCLSRPRNLTDRSSLSSVSFTLDEKK